MRCAGPGAIGGTARRSPSFKISLLLPSLWTSQPVGAVAFSGASDCVQKYATDPASTSDDGSSRLLSMAAAAAPEEVSRTEMTSERKRETVTVIPLAKEPRSWITFSTARCDAVTNMTLASMRRQGRSGRREGDGSCAAAVESASASPSAATRPARPQSAGERAPPAAESSSSGRPSRCW
eukprot:5186932-Pleurochrysis_carterae.AAC.7